jgi:threonine aldolase
MIDLRSDVCSVPTEPMWEAMRTAKPGWALLGEDPSVNRLERLGADLLGKEAAVFTATCSQANLIALLALAKPGTEVAVGRTAHINTSEAMAIENVANLRVRLLDDADGDPALEGKVDLICLENTHTRSGGRVLTAQRIAQLATHAQRTFIDGARLLNAAAATGLPPAALAAPADMVAISLNKGLSAPFGALLAGRSELVEAARRHLRRIGGASVHRAGIMAAAGIVALETMRGRIADDHARAQHLAELIGAPAPSTNIVLYETPIPATSWIQRLAVAGVLGYPHSERRVRFVTHRMIDDNLIERAASAITSVR